MRIVHLLHEIPYPPTSGIRCDMARRLEAFAALGHHVFAIAWVPAGEHPSSTDHAKLARSAEEVALLAPAAPLRRLWNLRRHPSYIAARIPAAAERAALIARLRTFRPDLIWLEGVHPAWLAHELKRALGVPLAYRAHNIEHRYLAEQARLAPTLRQRLALTAGTWGLETAERRLHATADHVFDISADDLAYWREAGFANGAWLPPQPDPAVLATARAPAAAHDIDLLFVGSLSSPNNIAGLLWYLDAIHPLVTRSIPDVRLSIAGRKPSADLARRIAAAGATLIADPVEVAPLFASAGVTLNPILHGSGVNIKTIDMLATGRPVITTTKGVRGLPAEVVAQLDVADNATAFAALATAAVRAARRGGGETDRTALIERVFGRAAVADALARCAPPAAA